MCATHRGLQLLFLQRTALSDEDIRAEVAALEQQGHRRLLVLTGEHPKYTFDQFLHVSSISSPFLVPCFALAAGRLAPPASIVLL